MKKALSKLINVAEFGTVTKQSFMDRAKAAGWTVKVQRLNGYQNGKYSRTKFNRLAGSEQEEYEKKLREAKNVYSIHPPQGSAYYDISKTEYDYFQDLECVKIGGVELLPMTITRTPDGVALSKDIVLTNAISIAELFQYALNSYSFVLPYNKAHTAGQWVELIRGSYDEPRTERVIQAIKAVMK